MALYLEDSFHSRAAQFIALYITSETELPLKEEKLSDCTLPAMVEDDGLFVSGLCHVARQVVKHSAGNTRVCEEKKKIQALLV